MADKKKVRKGEWSPAMVYGAIGGGVVASILIARQLWGNKATAATGGRTRYTEAPKDYPRGMSLVADMANLAVRLGAPAYAVELCLLQADSESKGNPLAGRGIASRFPPGIKPSKSEWEAGAAEKGFFRNYARYGNSPDARQGPFSPAVVKPNQLDKLQLKYYRQTDGIVPDLWTFGSGGLYGQLPSTGLGYTRNDPSLISSGKALPLDVFDPWRSTVMHLAWARRMTKVYLPNLPPHHRNIYALKRAAASVTLYSDINELKRRSKNIRRKMPERLARHNIDPSFVNLQFKESDWASWPGAWQMIVEGESTSMVQESQITFSS